nr:hypothetical protein [Spirochaetota bacterium]
LLFAPLTLFSLKNCLTQVIKKDLMQKLTKASVATGESMGSIVSVLLRKYAIDNERRSMQWSRVRYQGRNNGQAWHRLHLVLNPDEYEFFLDMRKVFIKSVSSCVGEAIIRYLDEMIYKIKNNADNYRYKNYSFCRVKLDGVICWILSWGVPRKPLTQLRLE